MKTQKFLKHLLLIAILSTATAGNMFAAAFTWTGGGADGNWTTTGNWGGVEPTTGQSVGFAGTTNLNVNNNMSSSTYTPAGISFAAGSGAFDITGNVIKIKGGIGDAATGVNIVINVGGAQNNQLTVTGTTNINASTSATLTIDGSWQASAATLITMNGGGTINLNWNAGIAAPLAISGNTTVNLSNAKALGSSTSFSTVSVAGGSALQLQNNITLAAPSTQTLTLSGTGVGSNGALENVSGINSYAGAISVGAGGASVGADAASALTLSGGVTNNGNLLTVVGSGSTTFSTTPITGTGGLTMAGSGTLTLSGSNGYSGVTTVSSGSMIITNTANSATGTGSLTVTNGATFGGTGLSSGTGFSISGTGTATGSRATVLVGRISSTDTSTVTLLTLSGSGNSIIQNANLSFNLNAQTAGGLGGTSNGGSAGGLGVSGSGTEMSVGSTAITFGSGVQSVMLTLNIQGEPAIIGENTAYVLIAGTVASGGLGLHGSQYSGITGTTTSLGLGETETVITGNNLQLAFGTTLDGSYYANSYLVLYQNTNTGTDDIDVIVVPEPGTWAMMLSGLAVLVFWQRRKSKA
jgi:fibronectin-binding autotransporter adhesin